MRNYKKVFLFLVFYLVQQIGIAQCDYQLVWSDEFSGTAVDLNNWSYQLGAGGWGNAELQTYTSNNAIVQNGILQITAEEPSPNNYTSSRIRSINNFDIKYGRLEASIKLPAGQGLWPAFWMMPTCSVSGGWPSSGEIDIMEYLGHQNNISYATCHFGNSPTDKGSLGTQYTLPSGNYTNGFHLFAIEWSENNVKWFIDNVQIFEVNNTDITNYNWPFNEEFHFILNMAVGGNWPGSPNAQTNFPATMEVDYVRAYKYVEDIEISGNLIETANATGSNYSVPQISGATYDWYIPSCATLVSGQGTDEIVVDWGEDGGELNVVIGLPCQTIQASADVSLTHNQWQNPGFEFGFKDWVYYFAGGAWGSFDLELNNSFAGSQHVCLAVNNLGVNFWDAQFRHPPTAVNAGSSYHLHFYAKADQANQQMRVDFRDVNGNNSVDNVVFNLTDSWAYYDYIFAPSSNIASLSVDFNHGFQTGQYCYDEVYFDLVGPAIGTCSTVDCVSSLYLMNTAIQDGLFKANINVNSTSKIQNGQLIDFRAGEFISLEAGFEVNSGAVFNAEIEPCN